MNPLSPEVLSGLRDRLEPCPFCGGAVELTSSKTLGDRLFCIKCPDDSPCVGSGLGIYVVAGQVETAIAAWNRRAALDLYPPVVEEQVRAYIERLRDKSAFAFGHTEAEHRGADEIKAVVIADLEAMLSPSASPSKPEEGAWRYDLDAVPRDRDFLIQYDHKEVTLGHYLDNSKTQWPYEGIRPCRSMRPERVSEKIIAWRELPSPDTAGSSDPAVASPNGEHLRPLADREKSAASPVPEPQAVAWRIDTDDQVELLAKECGINNRRYMTPKDYSIWCEQQRQFARLAAAPLSGGGKVEVTNGVVDAQWQWLCDKDDRSSPVEYPDMALVTRDELGEIIVAVLSTMGGKP